MVMKLGIPVLLVLTLLFSACSHTQLAKLIEPRKPQRALVYQQAPRSAESQAQHQRVIYTQPEVRVRPAHKPAPSCRYVVRDLSKPGPSNVWCHPKVEW